MAGKMRKASGFTLIELLTVIAIILLVAALSLPNFIAMMKGQRWKAAVSNIQGMVMRARALAVNARTDMSVEFAVDADNGTVMHIESEVNEIERIPELMQLQREAGGYSAIYDFLTGPFYDAGGRWASGNYYESRCRVCGHEWSSYSSSAAGTCPSCGKGGWQYAPDTITFYYGFTYNPSLAAASVFADNAWQSEAVLLSGTVTIDLVRCRTFINWDSRSSVEAYGYDDDRLGYHDLRFSVNGALVQSQEPIICLVGKDGRERQGISVVRCTGRVIPARLP